MSGFPARGGLQADTTEAMEGTPVRHVVGIGEFAVSAAPLDRIVTHALGSCVAVCIWDPGSGVGGLLHFLLPDAAINPDRARVQPATFANSGIPLLFQAAYAQGLEKHRCRVRLVGGADVSTLSASGARNVARRNLLAARQILWRHGLFVEREETGGTIPRNVTLHLRDGLIEVTSGGDRIQDL